MLLFVKSLPSSKLSLLDRSFFIGPKNKALILWLASVYYLRTKDQTFGPKQLRQKFFVLFSCLRGTKWQKTSSFKSSQVISVRLNGTKNYLLWSKHIFMYLRGQRLTGYVIDTVKRSEATTEKITELQKWEADDGQVMP
jgi:gag-polypeptide of LTR copia-type